MATIVVSKVSEKLCLSGTVICGRKGPVRNIPGGKVVECRNRWGCRYQVDLSEMPEAERQKRLRSVMSTQ